MKHFEQVWEDAEELSTRIHDKDIGSSIKDIQIELQGLNNTQSPNEMAESIGRVLFNLSAISKILNINVYSALVKTIEDEKIQLHEFEEG